MGLTGFNLQRRRAEENAAKAAQIEKEEAAVKAEAENVKQNQVVATKATAARAKNSGKAKAEPKAEEPKPAEPKAEK